MTGETQLEEERCDGLHVRWGKCDWGDTVGGGEVRRGARLMGMCVGHGVIPPIALIAVFYTNIWGIARGILEFFVMAISAEDLWNSSGRCMILRSIDDFVAVNTQFPLGLEK